MVTKGWRDLAACRGMDTRIFYTASIDDRWTPERAAPAVAVCRSCPVALECEAAANRERDEHGIRGGYTPSQRNTRRRRPRYQTCMTCSRVFATQSRSMRRCPSCARRFDAS